MFDAVSHLILHLSPQNHITEGRIIKSCVIRKVKQTEDKQTKKRL